jgi:hypothetical protein
MSHSVQLSRLRKFCAAFGYSLNTSTAAAVPGFDTKGKQSSKLPELHPGAVKGSSPTPHYFTNYSVYLLRCNRSEKSAEILELLALKPVNDRDRNHPSIPVERFDQRQATALGQSGA